MAPGERLTVSSRNTPPLGRGSFVLLALLYRVPRLTAPVAAEFGADVDQAFKIGRALLLTLEAMCGKIYEFWPKDPDGTLFLQDAFEPVNWPWLAAKAGTPDWEPPGYAPCWIPLDAEERHLSVLKGEEEAARRPRCRARAR
jgi:hypothetical protein